MTQDYILLSGGLDSAALAYILTKGQGQQLRALYVDHGQRASSPELSSAHKIAQSLSIKEGLQNLPTGTGCASLKP